MMNKLIGQILVLTLLFTQPLLAANQKPTDVPTPTSPQPTATYAAGSTLNTLGDGSNAQGGTPPYLATMNADVPTSPTTGWLTTGSVGSNFVTIPPASEAKFRFTSSSVKVLYDDPIRNFAEPGTSHCHNFFGNRAINAFSTYSSLRTRSLAYNSGGRVQASGYWVPCPVKTNPFGDGFNYAVPMYQIPIYYKLITAYTAEYTRIPRGIRMVTGVNMDDPDDLASKAEIAAANAQPGTAGRYSYIGDGWRGWDCTPSGGSTLALIPRYLKNTDGTDPWAGACTDGSNIGSLYDTPECWNGRDPWVPGGYKHMRHAIWDNVVSRPVCPNHWWRIPSAEIKPQYHTHGFSDHGNWRLSSDNAAGVAAGRTFRNGESGHTDWFPAWDDATLMLGLNSAGLTGFGGSGVKHELNSGLMGLDGSGNGIYLNGGTTPDASRTPLIADLPIDTNTASTLYRIRVTTPTGNKTITVH